MYSEQLAIFLLVAANSLASQPGIGKGQIAREPRGGTEQLSVNLKLDPRFSSHRTLHVRGLPQRKPCGQAALLASND
jgi:hypothetical protein